MLDALFLAAGLVLSLPLAYYLALAVVGLWPRQAVEPARGPDLPRIAILVPAHDEAGGIGRTLESLMALDYPPERHRVVVVADNCSDDTAVVVREFVRKNGREGIVECIERHEPKKRGKGHAITWALEVHFAVGQEALGGREPFDALLIVDADSVVASNLLRLLAAYLERGEDAIQAYYDVLEPEHSPSASVTWVGTTLSRRFKYLPRARLGGSSNLCGNGMCFRWRTLERVPWRAVSISEDLEYQLELLLAGVRIAFAPEAWLAGEIAPRLGDFQRQRARWDSGRAELRARYLPRLLRAALREHRPALLDAALELVVPPYSHLGGLVLGTLSLDLLVSWLRGKPPAGPAFTLLATLSALFLLYVLLGLLAGSAPPRIWRNLICAPLFLLGRLGSALARSFRRPRGWEERAR